MADLAMLKELLKLAKYIKSEGLDFSTQSYFDDGLPLSLDGWCIGHPPFVALGLRRHVVYKWTSVVPAFGLQGEQALWCNDALATFFDINYDMSKFIFGTWREVRDANHKFAFTTKPINRTIANDIDFQIERIEILISHYFPGWDEEQ